MIPGWIMESSFWLVIVAIGVTGAAVLFFGGIAINLAIVTWGDGRRAKMADPARVTVPAEVYRVAELREFVDALWMKIYGHFIDDFTLVRIDRALGRATVGEYRILVMREIQFARDNGNPMFRDREMFLTLARRASIDAELSRSGEVRPADLIEFQKIADREPAHRS